MQQIHKYSNLENLFNEDNCNNDKDMRSMQFLGVMKDLEQKISNSGRTLIRDDLRKMVQIYCEAHAEGGSSTANSWEQMRKFTELKHSNNLLLEELNTFVTGTFVCLQSEEQNPSPTYKG